MAWEYKVFTLFGTQSSSESLEELNELGEQGWEAVCPVGPFLGGPLRPPEIGFTLSVKVLLKREKTQQKQWTIGPILT